MKWLLVTQLTPIFYPAIELTNAEMKEIVIIFLSDKNNNLCFINASIKKWIIVYKVYLKNIYFISQID